MLEGEVFQHPLMPAVKETNMKKNPTMKRAIIARIISGVRQSYRDSNFNPELTYPGHLFLVELGSHVVLVGDVVVNIPAPGLHRGHVDLHQAGERDPGLLRLVIQLLAQVTFSEEAPCSCVVQRALVVLQNIPSLGSFQLFAVSPVPSRESGAIEIVGGATSRVLDTKPSQDGTTISTFLT